MSVPLPSSRIFLFPRTLKPLRNGLLCFANRTGHAPTGHAPSLIALLLCLCLCACAGRDYPLSAPDSMGLIPEKDILADYSIERDWWKAYDDPVLDELVTLALARNVDLAKSTLATRRAFYQARQAGAELIPTASGSGGMGATRNTDTGSTSRNWDAGLSVSYELDLWQRVRDTASAQEWEYRASTEDRESARLLLLGSVSNAYYNLLYLRQAREVNLQSLVFYEDLYRIIQQRFLAGKVDALEPMSAQQSLLAARNSITDLENQIRQEEQNLHDLLNLPPDAVLPIVNRNLLDIALPTPDLDVPVFALSLRPDVKAAEYRILRAFRLQNAARAALYPSITVGASLNVSADSAGTLFDVPLLGGSVKINLPFLQWNKVRWNINISENDFESAKLDFTQTVTTALNEVDTFYFSFTNALALLENSIKKHETDAKISVYREQRYQLGADELKNWLEAKRTENDSMLSVLRAKYDAIQYANAVFKALGGRLRAIE